MGDEHPTTRQARSVTDDRVTVAIAVSEVVRWIDGSSDTIMAPLSLDAETRRTIVRLRETLERLRDVVTWELVDDLQAVAADAGAEHERTHDWKALERRFRFERYAETLASRLPPRG